MRILSDLNQMNDIPMDQKYAETCRIMERELQGSFELDRERVYTALYAADNRSDASFNLERRVLEDRETEAG